jgi:hypothetical protein
MTAGRKPKKVDVVDVIDPSLDQDKINNAMAQMRMDENQIALATAQQDSAVRAVALQMGYQLPADCTDPDLIQRDISANMRRSVEACLEVGKGLRVLKVACQHGNFMVRLDELGIEASVARRFMDTANKFAKRATSHVLGAAGGQSKLFEMLILDDEQIEELELTGQTGELALDDIATMSVKELRMAVREARADKDASDKLLADKNAKIDKLSRHIKKATPDQVLLEIQKEATTLMNDALGCVRGQIRSSFIALMNHTEDDHSIFMAGLLGQLQADLSALREEFNLPDVSTAADQALAAEVAQWALPSKKDGS